MNPADPPRLAPESPPTADWNPQDTLAHPEAAALPDRVQIPGYEIQGELGRGGMGVVYRARHIALNRVVALKVILAGGHAGESDLARFRTEAESIARLSHPNIVQVYEVADHEGMPFFSLEFCAGGSLEKILQGTPLPAAEAARLVATLARAMQAAHEHGVIHRDLKPANVLLTSASGGRQPPEGGVVKEARSTQGADAPRSPDLMPKITDFGLAKKLGEQGPSPTHTGSIMGTPSYMAPEQASGSKEVGPAADVYALGAILYECLTGRPPFRAATPFDTIMQVLTEEPVPPRGLNPGVPRDLEIIALKCLRKGAAQRYARADELADDLDRWGNGEPIRARPTPAWERAWKWCRRRPAAAALVAVSAVALAALLGVGAWYNRELKRERDYAWEQEEIASTERDDAEKAREAAEKARDEAEKRRVWAEHNFKKANEAVDAMLAEVGETWLKFTPQAAPIRKILLEKALAFYKEFLNDRQDDPVIRRQVVQAHIRVANVHSLLGEDGRALDSLKQAIAAGRDLVGRDPKNVKARETLALALSDLGSMHKRLGKKQPAEKAYLEAMDLLAGVARDRPDETDHPRNRAGLLNNLGVLSDDPAVSLPRFEEAVKLFNQVIAKEPARASARTGLAATLNNLSLLLLRMGELDRSEKVLRDGIAQLEAVGKDAVTVRIEGSDLALAKLRINLGDLYLKRGKWQKAEEQYGDALPFFEKQAREQVRAPEYRLQLAMAHVQKAIVFRETRRPAEAEKHDVQAAEILEALVAEYPYLPEFRDRLASLLNSRGLQLERAGKLPQAEKTFLRALELFRGLAGEQVRDDKHVEGQAMVHNNLAHLYLMTGRHALAEKEFKQGLKLRQDLAKAHPMVPRYRADIAASHNNLGGLYASLGKLDDADRSYRQAIRDWKALVKVQPGVPEFVRNLGKAHYNLGNLRGKRDHHSAIECYDDALAILGPLVEANPKVAQYTHDLAQTRANRAIQCYHGGKVEEAEKDFLAVLPLFKGLFDDHPSEHEYLKDLSIAHHTLGILYQSSKRPALAKKELSKALELRRKLVKDHGGVPEYHELLGGTMATLAQYHWQRGEREEAQALYEKTREMFEGLLEKYPDQASFAVSLARIAFNQGLFAASGGERKEALAAFTRGATVAEKLIESGLQTEDASELWLQCRRHRAKTLGELGRHKEALADWERIFKLAGQDELRDLLRPSYALALARAGDHARAATEASKAARGAKDAAARLGLARVHAVCLNALAGVKNDDERERLAKSYAAGAMKLLQKVPVAQRRALEKDADFETLRGRPEWKQ